MNKLRYTSIIILLLSALSFGACTKVKKPDVPIKQAEMTSILTDLYLADGLLNNPGIRSDFANIDSTENYMRVIEKHGYTMADFEANVEYYFKSEPKKYEEIYDRVLATLSEMEAKNIEARGKSNPSRRNLWNGKTNYRLPDDGTANPVEFSIPIEGMGKYTIKARLTLFEDDQSIDPRATIYFWYDDGTEDGYRDIWDSEVYQKVQRSQSIEFQKELTDTNVTHIKGRLIDFSPQPGHWEMHSSLSGIVVTYNPAEEEESSYTEN